MEVDGAIIPQSQAQMRYVGKIGGLYPTDPVQAAFADAAIDAVMDIHIPVSTSGTFSFRRCSVDCLLQLSRAPRRLLSSREQVPCPLC